MNAPIREAARPIPPSAKIALFVLTIGISLFIFSFCTILNFAAVTSFLAYSFCLTKKDNLSAAIVNICKNATIECIKERCSNNITDDEIWRMAYKWTANLNIAPCVIGIYPTAVLGAWGDLHNRKHAILVPVAGSTIGAIILFFIKNFAPER